MSTEAMPLPVHPGSAIAGYFTRLNYYSTSLCHVVFHGESENNNSACFVTNVTHENIDDI